MTLARVRQFVKDYRAWLREYAKVWDASVVLDDSWSLGGDNTYDLDALNRAFAEICSTFARLQKHRVRGEKILTKSKKRKR